MEAQEKEGKDVKNEMKNKFKWFLIGWIACLVVHVIACGFTGLSTGRSVGQDHKAASVCDYRVAFIYRATYKTDEDFYRNVTAQIEWLWRHGYEVINLKYEYGFNMIRKSVLRFAIISYKEIKNAKEQKESH